MLVCVRRFLDTTWSIAVRIHLEILHEVRSLLEVEEDTCTLGSILYMVCTYVHVAKSEVNFEGRSAEHVIISWAGLGF
jgi:hypothetical protein